MKELKFRPLRIVRDKIVVASYMQWNKLRTTNYNGQFRLIVDKEYESLPPNEFVNDHKGEQLYHFTYNPWEVFEYHGSCLDEGFDWDRMRQRHKDFIIVGKDREGQQTKSYFMRGADSAGTPTFTHYDTDRVTQDDTWAYYGADAFDPLTVWTVINWFGWVLWNLSNAQIEFKEQTKQP